ncbi:MAG: universal stress protein [Syntrophales bacterium]|nr:universal stress protein [Syntrophales bacterium]
MYKQALVPLDGSDLAECALNHVKSMMKDGLVREATLFNVVKVEIPWIKIDDQFEHIDVNLLREKAFQSSQKYLAGMESRLASEGIKVKTASLEAVRPDGAISDYAREKGMNIIIIATHGYSGMKKMLLGSVAFGVLNQSSVPVLLIRPESCRV